METFSQRLARETERGTLLLLGETERGTLLLLGARTSRWYALMMARIARKVADDGIYHVLNRGNCKMRIFHKAGDFAAFIKLLEEGRRRVGMRVLGYCLMDNHWHFVLWPRRARDLSRFIGWVSTTHVRRWRAHRNSVGEGHLYQGRYKSFIVQDDRHFLTLMRYVEANPLRAGKVPRAQDWRWSSLNGAAGADNTRLELTSWPLPRPADWIALVNRALERKELDQLRTSVARQRPYGDEKWTLATAARLGLQSTLRDPWRPKKKLRGAH